MRATFLLALVVLVGCSSPERASMTIHAIAPTGDTWYRPPQPIWRFAITNTGTCQLVWESCVEVRGGSDREYSHAGGHIEWPQGVLAPSESLFTNMIVPAATRSVWRATVEFWRVSARDLKKAHDDAPRFGYSTSEFCPRRPDTKGTFNDEWHY
jgi:hypothetical protein